MKIIDTKDAVGYALCHDITQIIKGEIKDARFRKGHIVTKEDIPVLLSLGKDHIYVLDDEDDTMMHENDAAQYMIDLTITDDMSSTPVKEGKMELVSNIDGYFTVDVELLHKINMLDDIMIASIKGDEPIKKGTKLAGMRIIPLFIKNEQMENMKNIINEKRVFDIKPFVRKKAGIVTTGSEVYYGRIKDEFTPVIREKLKNFGVDVIGHETVYDNTQMIVDAITKLKNMGCDIILCTGGMSVDPDDLTPKAISTTATKYVTYGTPVLPGAMFALSYFEDGTPIMGLPGSVMFCEKTVFDIILPRALANIKTDKKYIASLGHGGLL